MTVQAVDQLLMSHGQVLVFVTADVVCPCGLLGRFAPLPARVLAKLLEPRQRLVLAAAVCQSWTGELLLLLLLTTSVCCQTHHNLQQAPHRIATALANQCPLSASVLCKH